MKPAQIVLIEDNPADANLVQIALDESGISHVLTKFKDGKEAVDALCPDTPPVVLEPDVILLDLNTPRIDGFEALVRLKQTPRLSSVPIALLTSSRARADKQRAAIQGVRYIEKPSQLDAFLSTVARAVKEMLAVSA